MSTFNAAVRYLEGFIHGPAEPALSAAGRQAVWELRQQTMARLLARLGNPHQMFPSVHVGGTSGKGSVAAYIASVLRAASYRTGLHTSPYLESAAEKIAVNGVPISEGALSALVERARPHLDACDPTYVQAWTALTFAHFAQQQVDCAVVEVSLGGRYDATNGLAPLVSVITNVGFDHTQSLGQRLEEIAWHKAGIVKPHTPLVTAVRQTEALGVIVEECRRQEASLYRLGKDFSYETRSIDRDGAVLDFQGRSGKYRDLQIGMTGAHQTENAALALAALEELRERGYTIPETALREGLRTARLPGRFEVAQQRPTVVLDGAHNPEKARRLRETLDAVFPGRPVTYLLAVGASKDLGDMLDALLPDVQSVVCTEAGAPGKPALPAAALAAAVRARGVTAAINPAPEAALKCAQASSVVEGVLCVTGSMYLVGRLRPHVVRQAAPICETSP